MFRTQGQANDAEGAPARADAVDDARLIARVAARDLRAFETLYRAYHPRLTRFLTNILRRPHLADEALNDTLMVVWRRADSYDGASKVSTWIFAIAYRTALKARSRYDEPREDQGALSRASPDDNPEDSIGRLQTRDQLMRAIDALSVDHRTVLDLTYFHEAGYREIAEIMDCPLGTVKTRMHHARLHLREALAGRLADWL